MFSSLPTPVAASTDSSPSVATQNSPDALSPTEDGRSSQFSSSFSIRAILSSSSRSPQAVHFPSSTSYPQIRLTENTSPPDYSPFSHYHCCQHGACTVNWQTDSEPDNKRVAKRKERGGPSKRSRTIFTPAQLDQLESTFSRQQYVAGEERRKLAASLKLTETHVKVWFQNRRIRFRKQASQQTATAGKA